MGPGSHADALFRLGNCPVVPRSSFLPKWYTSAAESTDKPVHTVPVRTLDLQDSQMVNHIEDPRSWMIPKHGLDRLLTSLFSSSVRYPPRRRRSPDNLSRCLDCQSVCFHSLFLFLEISFRFSI